MVAAVTLAVFSNRVVEYLVAPIKQKYPDLDLWWLVYVTWIVGSTLAYLAGLNLFTQSIPDLSPLVGQIISAVAVGGGSQLLADALPKSAD